MSFPIPREYQLYCGYLHPDRASDTCVSCSPREGRRLVCRQDGGDSRSGTCIAAEHCPSGQACVDDCNAGRGCFGSICSDSFAHYSSDNCDVFCQARTVSSASAPSAPSPGSGPAPPAAPSASAPSAPSPGSGPAPPAAPSASAPSPSAPSAPSPGSGPPPAPAPADSPPLIQSQWNYIISQPNSLRHSV